MDVVEAVAIILTWDHVLPKTPAKENLLRQANATLKEIAIRAAHRAGVRE